jgi:hypothetical protein
MSDTFIPMGPALISAKDNGFTPLPLKPGPLLAVKAAGGNGGHAAAAGPAASAPPAHDCPQPKVTLQRQGDVVTAIRIQCSCGQVIELKCMY